jgi:hypothetical protein
MKRQNRKIQELDGSTAALLAAGRLTDEEVERIASGPNMMASVWARIEAERVADTRPKEQPARSLFFGWRVAFAAVAVLIVAAVSLAVFMRTGKQSPVAVVAPVQTFVDRRAPASTMRTDIDPDTVSHYAAPKQSRPHFEQAAFRPEPRKVVEPVKGEKRPSLPPPPPLEFYTLPTVQDTADAVKDARIVRVELPRASLVALGANIPLEGDRQLVRADLLVGPDGVPRAIRLAD